MWVCLLEFIGICFLVVGSCRMGAQKQSRRKNARVWARRARGNASRGGQDIEDS